MQSSSYYFAHLCTIINRTIIVTATVFQAYKVYETGAALGLFRSAWQRSLYNVDRLQSWPWWHIDQTHSAVKHFRVCSQFLASSLRGLKNGFILLNTVHFALEQRVLSVSKPLLFSLVLQHQFARDCVIEDHTSSLSFFINSH